MADSTGPILAIGAITLTNQSILHSEPINWKIPLATGTAAIIFAVLENAVGHVMVSVAWLAFLTSLLVRTDPKVPTVVETLGNLWKG